MINIQSQPFRGGMNQDDDLDNLPVNDYELGENIRLGLGDRAFEKMYGTSSIGNVTGTCFGWFKFREFSAIFIDNGGLHEIYLLKENQSIEKVFSHEFDLDTSIFLIDCVLINNEILVFNNGVDEPMKVHIEMGRLTINYVPQTSISASGFITGTLSVVRGYVAITISSGTFTTGLSEVYLSSIVHPSYLDLIQDYSKLSNVFVKGNLTSTTVFLTELESRGSLVLDGSTIILKETENLGVIGYRKIGTRDYYLINTPPLEPPTVAYSTNADKKSNNLRDNVFQFQTKYVYYDNTESSWSPKSKMLYSESDSILDFYRNNGIIVGSKHPHAYGIDTVKEVVFAVSVNRGELYEFDRLSTINPTKPVFSTDLSARINTTFFNDEALLPIELEDADSLFDRVPKKVNSLEVLDESILALGGSDIDRVITDIDARIIPEAQTVDISAQTDFVLGYHYDNTGRTATDTFTKGTELVGSYHQYMYVSNLTGEGNVVDGSASTDVKVVKAISQQVRSGESNEDKSYVYFDFSSAQSIGTTYEVAIRGSVRSPDNQRQSVVIEDKATFVAKTTSTSDLISEIISWINNNDKLHDVPFGKDGDVIETQAKAAGSFISSPLNDVNTTTVAKSSNSIQIYSGLQCVHSDPSHYHWYQMDILTAEITKKTSQAYSVNTFKNQSKHPFAIRYYDRFNRVLDTKKLGELDLSVFNTLEEYYTAKIYINNLAPLNATRFDILYAGNRNFKNFLYATVKNASALLNNSQTIELELDEYNTFTGSNLSYSFTEGDKIQRLYSNGGSYTELSDENKKQFRVLEDNSGVLKVESESGNIFADNDLVVITTPKLQVEDEDTLFYEIGESFNITDRLHEGNVATQTDGTETVEAALELDKTFMRDSGGKLQIAMFRALVSDPAPPTSFTNSNTITILNGGYAGTYTKTNVSLASFPTADGWNGADVDVAWDENRLAGLEDSDPIYFTWEGATNSINSVLKKEPAIIDIKDFGDVYLRYRGSEYSKVVESYSISDKYVSNFWGKGRPATISNSDRIDGSSLLYYSEPYFNNTNLNGISTIYGSNFEEYKNGSGAIKKLLEHNDRLLLFFERKVGWAMVNKALTSTADGDVIQSLSGDIISPTENYFSYEGGIGNQVHSVVRSENWIYFADPYNANICRISNSGVDIISNVKMNSYFTELFKDTSLQIYSTFDADTSTLILHLKSDTINKQLTWSETRDRWISFWDIDCQRLLFDRVLFSLNNNRVYKHTTTAYNDIHGTPVTSKITKSFVGDQSLKTWKTLMLDPIWIDTDTITITNERGQSSTLLASDFEQDGQGFWTNFLQDANTPVVTDPLINGDDLQSKILTITLTTSDSAESKLRSMVVTYESAE